MNARRPTWEVDISGGVATVTRDDVVLCLDVRINAPGAALWLRSLRPSPEDEPEVEVLVFGRDGRSVPADVRDAVIGAALPVWERLWREQRIYDEEG